MGGFIVSDDPNQSYETVEILPSIVNINAIIAAANNFNPLNPTVVKLSTMILDPYVGIKEMANLIAYDQALTLKLLKAANSAYVGRAMRITNVQDAISFIGEYQTLNLLLSCTLGSELLALKLEAYKAAEGDLWHDSVLSSITAEQAPRFFETSVPQVATTGALLYNVGKVVMARFISGEIMEYISICKAGGKDQIEAEMEILNVHYGEIGGLIAQHWGLPHEMIVGINFHHDPDIVKSSISDVTHICHNMVDYFRTEKGDEENAEDPVLKINPNVIERLKPNSDDWFEKLAEAVKERFEKVRSSYGL